MQRYFSKEQKDDHFILEANDLYHIKTVMRMKDNDKIEVIYDSRLFICCIENVKSDIAIKILKEEKISQDSLPKITLFIPLLKEQKMDLIIQKSTELGIYKIAPIVLNRSIIKVKDELSKKKLRWMKIAKEASEQSKRSDITIIDDLKKIDDLKNIDGLNLICSTQEKIKNIKNIVKKNKNCDKINIVIGPEGGLEPKEENMLIDYGFIPVTLGPRIMRVETVPIYIMSILNYEYME